MKNPWTKVVLGLLVSLVALVAVLQKIDWQLLLSNLQSVKPVWLLGSLLCLSANLLVRAKRWGNLLRPFYPVHWFRQGFRSYMIGYMANMVLPLKAGELIRTYHLAQKTGMSKTIILTTVVSERLLDMVCLTGLLGLVLFVGITQVPVEVIQGGVLIGGAIVFFLAAAWSFLWLSGRFKPAVSEGPDGEGGLKRKAMRYYELILQGVREMINLRAMPLNLFYSALIWLLAALSLSCYIQAFSLDLPWYASIFLLAIVNLGMMIPSSPGAIGLAHYLYVFALTRFLVAKSTALGFAVVAHGVGFITVVLVGVACLWAEGLSFREMASIKRAAPEDQTD